MHKSEQRGKIDNTKIIVEKFSVLLSIIIITNPKISNEMEYLNNSTNQWDLKGNYRTPIIAKYTLFLSMPKIFSRKEQMLGHKQTLINLKALKSCKVCSSTIVETNH